MLPQEYQDNTEQDIFLQDIFFPVHCCLEPQRQHWIGYLPVQYCPRSIKTALNRIFPIQCCLKPLGQHCARFLLLLCCVKSIKTTLIRNFSCAMLSGASWTTLHEGFYLFNVGPWLTDNFNEENNLYNVVLTMMGQHCICLVNVV